MKGRRIDFETGVGAVLQPGDYGRVEGRWTACAPKGQPNEYLANLAGHTIVEHEDGTITVSPSILVIVYNPPGNWHGYLQRGFWEDCDNPALVSSGSK